ncbi:MAG: hypothetical protein V1845_02380 [bacterium]
MSISAFALQDIAGKLAVYQPHQPLPMQAMTDILTVLQRVLTIARCTFWSIDEPLGICEIKAGLPVETHKFVKDPLEEHPDIAFAVKSPGLWDIIKDPLSNPLTQYFAETIKEASINVIFYGKIAEEHEENGVSKRRVLGMIVVDATKNKAEFDADEIELCQMGGRLIAAHALGGYEQFVAALLQEYDDVLRHRLLNPWLVIGGFNKRYLRKLERLLADGKITDTAFQELKRDAEIIDKEGPRLEQAINGLRSTVRT